MGRIGKPLGNSCTLKCDLKYVDTLKCDFKYMDRIGKLASRRFCALKKPLWIMEAFGQKSHSECMGQVSKSNFLLLKKQLWVVWDELESPLPALKTPLWLQGKD